MDDRRLHAAQYCHQVHKGQEVADRVDATAERGNDEGLDAREPASLFGEHPAGTGHQDGTKPRAIQMRHGIERDFLCSTQFQLGDDVADRIHATPKRTGAAPPAR